MSTKCHFLLNKFIIKVCVWRLTPPTATQGSIIPAMMLHPVYSLLLWDSMWTGRPDLLIPLSKHGLRMSIIVQQNATIYSFIIFLQKALHVLDDTLIHHQEHTQTVITTSGTG
jgi:hypothetical protein